MDEKIISLIFSLGRLVREHTDEGSDRSLSFIHLEMMKHIEQTKGLTMKDMALFLCIKAPSVTYLMEDLVKNGYAKRSHDTEDRRLIKIILTPKGQKILEELYPRRAESLRKVLSQLGTAEQKKFADILERIHKIYKKIS